MIAIARMTLILTKGALLARGALLAGDGDMPGWGYSQPIKLLIFTCLLLTAYIYISDLVTYIHMHVFSSKAVATPNLQRMSSLLASQKQPEVYY